MKRQILIIGMLLALNSLAYGQSGPTRLCIPTNSAQSNCVTITSTFPLPVTGTFSANVTGVATAAAPTYIEGTSNPFSLDLSGGLRITGTVNASSSAKATAAAPNYVEGSDDPFSQNLTGDLRTIAKQSGTWNITNISGTVSLPTGASTAAKQAALGTAGTASTDVITVQGITSMTALKVDGTGGTFPISGTVAATQSGTWTVQPGNTANSTAWLVTGTGGTFPITAAALPLPSGAATSALQTTINTTLGLPFQAGGSIGNTSFAATQATASNLNATVVGTGTFAVQATGTVSVNALPSGNNNIGNVGTAPRTAQLSVASINFSSSGDNTIIAAGSGAQTIKIYRMYLVVAGVTNLTIKDGVITDAAVPMSSNGSITWDENGEPWSTGAAATAWKINSSNAVQVSGRIYYLVN